MMSMSFVSLSISDALGRSRPARSLDLEDGERTAGALVRGERQTSLGQRIAGGVAWRRYVPGRIELARGGIDRHRQQVGLLETLQIRIDVVREPRKQREVCQRRDDASGQDDLEAPDPVRQPTEDDEEGRADK